MKQFFVFFVSLVLTTICFVSCNDEPDVHLERIDMTNLPRTGLPVVMIDTPDSMEITSKEEWMTNISIVMAE